MRYLLLAVITFSLFACASIDPKVSKWDAKNYQANKDMAIATMKTLEPEQRVYLRPGDNVGG